MATTVAPTRLEEVVAEGRTIAAELTIMALVLPTDTVLSSPRPMPIHNRVQLRMLPLKHRKPAIPLNRNRNGMPTKDNTILIFTNNHNNLSTPTNIKPPHSLPASRRRTITRTTLRKSTSSLLHTANSNSRSRSRHSSHSMHHLLSSHTPLNTKPRRCLLLSSGVDQLPITRTNMGVRVVVEVVITTAVDPKLQRWGLQ